MMTFEEQNKKEGGKEVDIVWLIRYYWSNRKCICKFLAACMVISVIAYFCRQKKFTCTASVLPLSSQSSNMKGIGMLAGMAGMNLSSLMNSSSELITPDLFSEVALSTPSLIKIMNTPVTWEDPDTIESLYSHTKRDSIPSAFGYIVKYTIMLPFTIKEALTEEPNEIIEVPSGDEADEGTRAIVIDKTMELCIKDLKERINVEVDDEVNLVRIECTAENAQQSAELTAAVIKRIQGAVTDFATKNARKNLNFIQEQYDTTWADFCQKRARWLQYKDTHRYTVEERADAAASELYENHNLSYSVVTTLQQQLAACKMELASNTPVFSVVEPVVKPMKKTSPKMLMHLLGGFFIGVVLSVGGMLVVLGYKQVFKPSEYAELYEKYSAEAK
ncbi:MAG: hypothetical protein ACI35N_00340 [Marinilabiliaceae bacterium]